jgi:hypothetical protein
MRCDGLPDARSVPELNRYLSLWDADPEGRPGRGMLLPTATLDSCMRETPEIIKACYYFMPFYYILFYLLIIGMILYIIISNNMAYYFRNNMAYY